MGRKANVDVPRLFALWADEDITRTEIARVFRVSDKKLTEVAQSYGLGNRGPRRRCETDDDPPPEEDAASSESLALSPWVQARIKELRLGMPA